MSKLFIDPRDCKPIASGECLSAIGLGTWAIRDYERAYRVFIYALEHGVNHVDTAEMYDSGRAEEFIGRVVEAVGRDNVFITTKMLPKHLRSRDTVLKAAKASLKRLGVSYVDLYLIHWPNEDMSISEQVRNFEAVYLEGYTRYIGVSNFNVVELAEAIHSTRKADIVVDQVYYSVLNRGIEKDLLPYAIENNVLIQAYTPLERGAIVSHKVLEGIGRKYGKTAIQVALNYLISHYNVVAIPKTENMEHLVEILGSMNWRLSIEDILFIKENV